MERVIKEAILEKTLELVPSGVYGTEIDPYTGRPMAHMQSFDHIDYQLMLRDAQKKDIKKTFGVDVNKYAAERDRDHLARVAKGIPVGVAKTVGAAAGAVLKSAGETVIDQATLPKRVTESVLTGKELKEITEAKAAVNVVAEVSTDVRKDGIHQYIQKQGEAYLDAVNEEIMAYDDPLQGMGEEVLGPIAFEIITGLAMDVVVSKFMGKQHGATQKGDMGSKVDADMPNKKLKDTPDHKNTHKDSGPDIAERRAKPDDMDTDRKTSEETKGSGVEINELEDVGESKSGLKFKYQHNPADNPKVLSDAIEDANAVYGYRPRKDGSLASFAAGEWDNPIAVEGYRQDRIAYHNRNEGAAQQMVSNMFSQGASPEEVARAVCEYRNQSRINAYIDDSGSIKNVDGYNAALVRAEKNLYENLIKYGKTPDQIIRSAVKGNPAMDACTGLYDEYFETY